MDGELRTQPVGLATRAAPLEMGTLSVLRGSTVNESSSATPS
ncbi:hypothetical protein ACWEHA_07245 [Amycolatopsis nivea]